MREQACLDGMPFWWHGKNISAYVYGQAHILSVLNKHCPNYHFATEYFKCRPPIW